MTYEMHVYKSKALSTSPLRGGGALLSISQDFEVFLDSFEVHHNINHNAV